MRSHPLFKGAEYCWLLGVWGSDEVRAKLLGLQKREKPLCSQPAYRMLSDRTEQLLTLGEMLAEECQCGGGHRREGTSCGLGPHDELGCALHATTDTLLAIAALRQPLGKRIQIRPRRSRIVLRLRRLACEIGREHTDLLTIRKMK